MGHGEHTKPLPSVTSLTGSFDSPPSRGPQMTESTPEAILKQNETFDEWLEPIDHYPGIE